MSLCSIANACSVIIGSFAALGTLATSPRKWNKLRGFVARIAAMQKVLRDVHEKASDLEVHDAGEELRQPGALRRIGSRIAAEQVRDLGLRNPSYAIT